MTLPCYKCKNAGFPDVQVDYVKETKEYFEPGTTTRHVHKEKSGGGQTAWPTGYARPKADTSARNAEIRETQKLKQEHERDMLDGQMAVALEYHDGMKLIADSNTKLSESQGANTIELAKFVERLTELLQKLSLNTAGKQK